MVRAFRVHLQARQRAGGDLVAGGPTPRLAPASDAAGAVETPPTAAPDQRGDPGGRSEPDGRDERGAEAATASEVAAGSERRPVGAARVAPPRFNEQSFATGAGQPGGEVYGEADPEPAARADRLAEVRAELGDCQRCKLARTRRNIVFGVGDPEAALMFVGEGPGANEDRVGEPFVGNAGQLLDKMIEAMGWTRQAVYIANVVKCRPPQNRTPEEDEISACRPFLHRQIEVIGPRVIVALGRPASQLLLETKAPISALRGRFQRYRSGVAVMPTFHPAYLLRTPARKRDTWNDLKLVIAELERLGVRSPRPPKT